MISDLITYTATALRNRLEVILKNFAPGTPLEGKAFTFLLDAIKNTGYGIRTLPGKIDRIFATSSQWSRGFLIQFDNGAKWPLDLELMTERGLTDSVHRTVIAARNEVAASKCCPAPPFMSVDQARAPTNFDFLFQNFCRDKNVTSRQKLYRAPDGLFEFFTDRLLASRWVKFHNENCVFVEADGVADWPHAFTYLVHPPQQEIQMSIETLLAENTAALKENTAALLGSKSALPASPEAAPAKPRKNAAAAAPAAAPASTGLDDDDGFDDAAPSRDDVVAALRALKDAKGKDVAVATMAKAGISSLANVPEDAKKLAELMDLVKKAK